VWAGHRGRGSLEDNRDRKGGTGKGLGLGSTGKGLGLEGHSHKAEAWARGLGRACSFILWAWDRKHCRPSPLYLQIRKIR
jgi:hypothetical protein